MAIRPRGAIVVDDADLRRDIREASQLLGHRQVLKMLRKHLRPVARKMAARISGRSRTVARSIKVWTKKGAVYVGSRYGKKTGVYHAHWFEFGTSSHTVRVKKKRVLAGDVPVTWATAAAGTAGDQVVFGKEVTVSGMRPTPFMRPVWAQEQDNVVKKLKDDLGKRLDAEWGKK